MSVTPLHITLMRRAVCQRHLSFLYYVCVSWCFNEGSDGASKFDLQKAAFEAYGHLPKGDPLLNSPLNYLLNMHGPEGSTPLINGLFCAASSPCPICSTYLQFIRTLTNQPTSGLFINYRSRLKLFGHIARAPPTEDHEHALQASTIGVQFFTCLNQ